jgi:hypothetical protein
MGNFSDALKKPLPSKLAQEAKTPEAILESVEAELFGNKEKNINDAVDTKCGDAAGECANGECKPGEECGGNCAPGVESPEADTAELNSNTEDDDEDFDPDDLSDAELAALDAELSGDELDSVVGDDDDDDEVDLTPDEEMEADDMMNMAATTMLVNDELNAEEKAQFLETQAGIAVTEGFMTEADVNQMSADLGLVQESKYNKKMIIRLDAASKKKQLYALAVNVSAAAHGDADYRKLRKVMKMRKILRARLEKKYRSEATKRMKIYFNRLKNSKSGFLNKIAAKHDAK